MACYKRYIRTRVRVGGGEGVFLVSFTTHYLCTNNIRYNIYCYYNIMIWSVLEGSWQQNITRRTCDREESLTGTYTHARGR